jgi:hypothetical protein
MKTRNSIDDSIVSVHTFDFPLFAFATPFNDDKNRAVAFFLFRVSSV